MNNGNNEIRFGTLAVEKGFITTEQVINALEIQVKENISFGKHRRIGMILFDQGLITFAQIDEILRELEDTKAI